MPLLSAVFIQLSLAPAELYPLAIIGFIPLLVSLERTRKIWQAVAVGLMVGFCYNVVGCYWVFTALKDFFYFSIIKSFILFLVYALIGHLQYPIFAVAAKITFRSKLPIYAQMLVLAFSFVFAEMISFNFFAETISFSLIKIPILTFLFRVLSYKVLTGTIVFINASIYFSVKRKEKYLFFIPTVTISLIGLGSVLYQMKLENKSLSNKYSLEVAIIQPNTSNEEKLQLAKIMEIQDSSFNKLMKMSNEAMQINNNIELIVWPETSYPSRFLNPLDVKGIERKNSIVNFIHKYHTAIIFGLNEVESEGDYNEAILVQEDGKNIKIENYRKTVLALMGEYNPFSSGPRINLGNGPTLFHLKLKNGKTVNLIPSICYESMSREFFNQAQALGKASAIIDIANEAWFGRYGAPYSSLMVTKMRAVETGLPLIKSGNSGLSGVLLPDGSVLSKTEAYTSAIGIEKVIISVE